LNNHRIAIQCLVTIRDIPSVTSLQATQSEQSRIMHYQQPTASSLQKMKVKASPEAPQLPEIAPHVSLHPVPIPEAVRSEAHDELLPQIVGSSEDLSWFSFRATLSEPFEQPDINFLASVEANNATATNRPANKGKQPAQQVSAGPSSQEERPSSSMSAFSFEVSPATRRYYAQALSTEDKAALARGDKNHNLKEWSGKDLIKHHEARKTLVPRVMPKVDKTNALASIEHDTQGALTKMAKKVRKVLRVPRIKVTDTSQEEEATWKPAEHWGIGESSLDLRSSRAPIPAPAPVSPPAAVDEVRQPRNSHIRAASSGDYFSSMPPPRHRHSRRPSPLVSSSGPPSSERVRSPLAREVQFRANPEATFDSFLVPVKQGHKTKLVTPKNSPEGSPNSRPVKQSRLSKMPSMPLLRKRSPEGEE
jgi:hypothetical protein